ncbi:hypothetical protein AHiyo4_39290 [Arthrobacter sp. Hiyo4]|nr:hypothetical protein AHiyo4_39290 [Arthrobacter sp. Hiyo4]
MREAERRGQADARANGCRGKEQGDRTRGEGDECDAAAVRRSPAVVPFLSLIRCSSRSLPIQGWISTDVMARTLTAAVPATGQGRAGWRGRE